MVVAYHSMNGLEALAKATARTGPRTGVLPVDYGAAGNVARMYADMGPRHPMYPNETHPWNATAGVPVEDPRTGTKRPLPVYSSLMSEGMSGVYGPLPTGPGGRPELAVAFQSYGGVPSAVKDQTQSTLVHEMTHASDPTIENDMPLTGGTPRRTRARDRMGWADREAARHAAEAQMHHDDWVASGDRRLRTASENALAHARQADMVHGLTGSPASARQLDAAIVAAERHAAAFAATADPALAAARDRSVAAHGAAQARSRDMYIKQPPETTAHLQQVRYELLHSAPHAEATATDPSSFSAPAEHGGWLKGWMERHSPTWTSAFAPLKGGAGAKIQKRVYKMAALAHRQAFDGTQGAVKGLHALLTLAKAWGMGKPRMWAKPQWAGEGDAAASLMEIGGRGDPRVEALGQITTSPAEDERHTQRVRHPWSGASVFASHSLHPDDVIALGASRPDTHEAALALRATAHLEAPKRDYARPGADAKHPANDEGHPDHLAAKAWASLRQGVHHALVTGERFDAEHPKAVAALEAVRGAIPKPVSRPDARFSHLELD